MAIFNSYVKLPEGSSQSQSQVAILSNGKWGLGLTSNPAPCRATVSLHELLQRCEDDPIRGISEGAKARYKDIPSVGLLG